MDRIKIYQVDAFTSELFAGNPAAVCPLENWLPDEVMQSIAMENNLSETSFFLIKNDKFYIRWFSPKVEIDLAGHPTLATAHIIFKEMFPEKDNIQFHTKIGDILSVSRKKNILSMDFPSHPPIPQDSKLEEVSVALKSIPSKFLFGRWGIIAVYENEKEVLNVSPNFDALMNLEYDGIILTAPGNNCDFVSRFFAPKLGIQEDPVTGSTHCELIPYWSKRLNKKDMIARQLSKRGGELYCSYLGDRVIIGGKAITYMQGELLLGIKE